MSRAENLRDSQGGREDGRDGRFLLFEPFDDERFGAQSPFTDSRVETPKFSPLVPPVLPSSLVRQPSLAEEEAAMS
jgi:hypothetical protein